MQRIFKQVNKILFKNYLRSLKTNSLGHRTVKIVVIVCLYLTCTQPDGIDAYACMPRTVTILR